MSMDVLKAEIQAAQLRSLYEIQHIIDAHTCQPVLEPKKGLFGRKIKVSLDKKGSSQEMTYPAPASREWDYQTPLPPLPQVPAPPPQYQQGNMSQHIAEARKNALLTIKNSAELHAALESLDRLEQQTRGQR